MNHNNMAFPILLTVAMACLVLSPWGAAQAPESYTLAWSDEFDGPSVDTNIWHYRLGISKESVQKPENVRLSGGHLRIAQKKESSGSKSFTGGGLISSKKFQFGYYETRFKAGKPGWHEAFWTTWLPQLGEKGDEETRKNGLLEIDCFEHYGVHDNRTFTFGAIQWAPVQGNLIREYRKVSNDLIADFHTYGFEFQEEYLRFYFDGKAMALCDLRGRPHHAFHLWLTSIATSPEAEDGGEALFDYCRFYTNSVEGKARLLKNTLSELQSGDSSRPAGMDLWLEAEDFPRLGGWLRTLEDGRDCLRGHPGNEKVLKEEDRIASTKILIPTTGEWTLWVRSRDYAKDPGTRTFGIKVGENLSSIKLGGHAVNGWAWENAGTFKLVKGVTTLQLLDTSAWYPRVDRLLLTRDPNFKPEGIGGGKNVEHDPVQY
ncbi:MAG: family 16 glycosylhydrolase [Spirochaetia bacterium]|nr:family 16 glycosylhydrolase [Spirochaetia bacterium]